jgi:hypothetical protein
MAILRRFSIDMGSTRAAQGRHAGFLKDELTDYTEL